MKNETDRMIGEIDRILAAIDGGDLSSLTAGQINQKLDRLDKARSKVNDELIRVGRGNERSSETLAKTDPLSLRFSRLFDKYNNLRGEVFRRYGPGAPSRLPTRTAKG